MPRFFTPARVCLLVLIRLYQSDCSSNSSLDLLDFIARHTLLTSTQDAGVGILQDRQLLFSSDITALASTLQQWSTVQPGRNVYDVFLHTVWTELHGLDSLHELVTASKESTMVGVNSTASYKTPFTPSSPIGQFVRRCYVEFTRLQFSDLEALWLAFTTYRAPSYEKWAAKNPDAAELAKEEVASNAVGGASSEPTSRSTVPASTASAVDTEILLGYAIHQLQRLGTRVPLDVKSRLESWISEQQESGTQSNHFFMAFFEYWRAGQYTMALESLHRFFDYSLAAKTGSSDNMKVYYQYALLHLSVLHADFECWEESIDAMNECIATARENHDSACLNFALSWLLYLRHAHPGRGAGPYSSISGVVSSNGGEYDEITFLKTKAREGKHWMLLSNTLLEESRHELIHAGSTNRAQEHILQAMYLNVQHDLRAVSASATILQASCLERLGQSHLACKMLELSNSVHVKHCPLTDRVRSQCRLASSLAQAGDFDRSLSILNELRPIARGVLKAEQRVKAFEALVHLRRHIHRADREASREYLSELIPLRSTSLGDPEIASEIDLLEVESLIRQKQYDLALNKVSAKLAGLKSPGGGNPDLALRLHFLILKARIFTAAKRAAKGFSIALRATSTAGRHLLIPVLLEGLAVLSNILSELSEFETARDLLASAIPHALEAQNTALVARMYVTMGEVCVGFAGHRCPEGSRERSRSMRQAMDVVELGMAAYERCEDYQGLLDCLLMKATIAGWSGDDGVVKQTEARYYTLLAEHDKEAAA